MSEEQALPKLAELPVLSELPDDYRKSIAEVFYRTSDDVSYEDGEVIIHGGYLSFDTGFVVYGGAVVVERQTGGDIELSAPAMLGEMSQFSAGDIRSATVRARGTVHALDFAWSDLYSAAGKDLAPEVYDEFRKAIEQLVWTRFPYRSIKELALFSGLDDALKDRVCSPLPGIIETVRLETGETLFREATLCKSSGFILIEGRLKLVRAGKGEKSVKATDIVGVFPTKSDQQPKWRATCLSDGDAQLLKFNWSDYTKLLNRRLSKEERAKLVESMKANAGKHFWY